MPGEKAPILTRSPKDWRVSLAETLRDPAELLTAIGLDARGGAEAGFPTRVPREFAARMRPDAADPLLRQVLPADAESETPPGWVADPVGDQDSMAVPGVLHKYHGRALLVMTGACAIHCRYCFRRHFPYRSGALSGRRLRDAVRYLRSAPGLSEIILSGGDPWMLPTRALERCTRALEAISGLRRLRVHTRMPVVVPGRVDAGLVDWLSRLPWPVAVVIHSNHAAEIDPAVQAALARLRAAGAALLNQSVLLRGVNDDPGTLERLSERLFECGVLPYYLHVLDPVAGAAHFEVSETHARRLLERLRRRLPGYLVPRLVREVAGAPYKMPLL